jgi:hypothetical protein
MRSVILMLMVVGATVVADHPTTAVPRVVVTAGQDSLPALDTASGIIAAEAYDALGRRTPTATITWAVHPATLATILPWASTRGHTTVWIGKVAGSGYVVASWKRSDGTTVSDSIRVKITHATVQHVSVYGTITLNLGAPTGLVIDSTQFGKMVVGDTTQCLHAVAWNKAGKPITGLPVHWSVSDTTVARTLPNGAGGRVCADTTVNPLDVAKAASTLRRKSSRA